MWKEFKEFIAKGNVIDLAVGVVVPGEQMEDRALGQQRRRGSDYASYRLAIRKSRFRKPLLCA